MQFRITFFLISINLFCYSQIQKESFNWTLPESVIFLNSTFSTLGAIDTMDVNGIYLSSSFPLKSTLNRFGLPSIDLLETNESIYTPNFRQRSAITFSALPHVGFSYLFGSQGAQLLRANYEQAFKKGFLLNAQIGTDITNGFYRNSGFSQSKYALQLARNSKRHSFFLVAFSGKEVRDWNGGLVSDSQALFFSPDILPVRKNDASSEFRNKKISLTNNINLINDSLRVFAIQTKHFYESNARTYSEQNSIVGSYDSIYFDSTQTSDKYDLNTMENQVGFIFKGSILEFSSHAVLRNWSYQNLEIKSDTTEFDLRERVQFKNKRFKITNSSSFNLFGAKNAFTIFTEASTSFLGCKLHFNHLYQKSLPNVFKRYYSSNNVFYKLENFDLQTQQKFRFLVSKSFSKQAVSFDYTLVSFNQNYFFNSLISEWQKDLPVSKAIIHQAKISSDFHFSFLHIYPSYTFTKMDESIDFLPQHTFETRVLIKGGIFKAKKLKGMLGFDFIALSSYKSLTYIPQMGIFDFNILSQVKANSGTMNAGVFTGFEVDKFRFYLRWDNLAYLWANRMQSFVIGSPLPSTQIKLGITWDFWN